MLKKSLFIIVLLLMSVFLLVGCNEKEKPKSICSGNAPLGFSTIEEYYDWFFTPYQYTSEDGELVITDFTWGDVYKLDSTEWYYNFVNDIQHGSSKIYYPHLSDNDELVYISLYEKDVVLGGPCVWFEYELEGIEGDLDITYSYIPSYEYYKRHLSGTDMKDSLYVREFVRTKAGMEFDEFSGGRYSKVFQKNLQLKDRSVLATFYKYSNRDNYDVTFVYEDLCVLVRLIPANLLSEDFWEDFYIEEYIHTEPETSVTETAETLVP